MRARFMPSFFSVINAGYHTLDALIKGPPKTLEEMHTSQEARAQTFIELMRTQSYKPHQIEARRQYWCAQTLFLAQLIRSNIKILEIIDPPVSIDNEVGLAEVIDKLITALNNEGNLQKFLDLLQADCCSIATTAITKRDGQSPPSYSGIQFFNGDVIELIQELSVQGRIVVVDNAPNSHRDGAAKYSAGSVEELFSRYTDSALKMALHFTDVHQRNKDAGYYAFAEDSKPLDVADYQRRYLQMVLTICAKLLKQSETYLESQEFFDDLFNSFPNQDEESFQLPVYFDIQNNAYEVPVDGGFVSEHWFVDTKNLTTVEGIFQLLETPNTLTPIKVVSYAAPDLRLIETSPLDARASSNKRLQLPTEEGNLGCMLTAGISLQCKQAIELAEQYKAKGIEQPIAVVFIMPGCGAFMNPEKSTAAHFISTIKYFYPQLAEQGIHCYVAEYNPKLHRILKQTSELCDSQLGEFNTLINDLTISSIRQQAIIVRERMVNLIENEGYTEDVTKHLALTIRLLKSKPGNECKAIAEEYKQNALQMQGSANPLRKALGAAMFALGIAIAATGFILSSTGMGLLPGMGVAAVGALMAGIGFGLFSHNKYRGLTQATCELIDETSNDVSEADGSGLLP
ncbi:hypothetical protein HRQ65_07860 [Tatlockia micdadei]|nr:hypothetical protein [Legionella micdadei]